MTNRANGLVSDKDAAYWPASIAVTGMALATYPVAVERGLMSRQSAIELTLATLTFFYTSPQGTEPDATGYRGFYYHFLDMATGRRAWQCELSTVDSAFLFAGMLTAAAYFRDDTPEQCRIRELTSALYGRADWPWAQNSDGTIGHGWYPESGFLAHRWEGYDEGLLLYVLALGSPTRPLQRAAFSAWAATYKWKRVYDVECLYSGPLFTHQFSHIWIDFRGIQDAFMRGTGIDYFENSRRAIIIQQRYAIDNPLDFKGYGQYTWGITASDGPGPSTLKIDGIVRSFYDYEGRGVPFGIDDGTLSPSAVVASLPFAPEIVLPTIDHIFYNINTRGQPSSAFMASFNPTFVESTTSAIQTGWVSDYCFGLNVGPVVLMLENHRTGLVWALMRTCDCIINGLRRAGFDGGWLATDPGSVRDDEESEALSLGSSPSEFISLR